MSSEVPPESEPHRSRRPDADRVASWCETIRALEPQIVELEWYRDEFDRVIEIVKGNDRILNAESYFPTHGLRWYVESQCMRIRRIVEQASPRHDVWSLRQLLEDMRRAAEAFVRGNVEELFDAPDAPEYPDEMKNFLVESMWRNVGDVEKSADRLKAQHIKDDLKALREATDGIRDYATKALAHYTKDVPTAMPSFGPISSATDVIARIAKRYTATLTGASMSSFAPVDQFDWFDVFRFAWKPRHPGEASPISRIDHVQLAMPAGAEESAREFYMGALGFQEVAKPPDLAARGGVWFRSGDVHVHLGVEAEFAPAKKAHPAFRCAYYDALMRRLEARGAAASIEPLSFGGKPHCYIVDPFGNRIEIISE